jgi:hypothetical protein
MKNEKGRKEDAARASYPLDASAGLYHEAQADGVPYEEDPAPFTYDAPGDSHS